MNRDLISLLLVGGVSFLLLGAGFWYYLKLQNKILSQWSIKDRISYKRQFLLGLFISGVSLGLLFINFNLALITLGVGLILHSVIFFNSNVTSDFSVLFWARFTGLGNSYIKFERISNIISGISLVLLAITRSILKF